MEEIFNPMMARNKKQNIKNKEGFKVIRKEAKKRWKARKKLQKVNDSKLCKEVEPKGEENEKSQELFRTNEFSKEIQLDEVGSYTNHPHNEYDGDHELQSKDDENEQDLRGIADLNNCDEGMNNNALVNKDDHDFKGKDDVARNKEAIRQMESDISPKLHGSIKEIAACEVIKGKKCLGAGTFGSCYLANYRGLLVVVKEYHSRSNTDDSVLKHEVIH